MLLVKVMRPGFELGLSHRFLFSLEQNTLPRSNEAGGIQGGQQNLPAGSEVRLVLSSFGQYKVIC